MLDLPDKDFKLAIINVFKILKETILHPTQKKSLKKNMRIMSHQIESINKEMEIIKRNQIKNSGIENDNNWNDYSLRGINRRFEKPKEPFNLKISSLKIESIWSEEQKEKGMKEKSLSNF